MSCVKRHELAVYLKSLLLGTSMLSRVEKNSSGFIFVSKRSENKLRQIAQNNRDIVVVRQPGCSPNDFFLRKWEEILSKGMQVDKLSY